jgi:aspartate/methionine/tyrosine aminotransferase
MHLSPAAAIQQSKIRAIGALADQVPGTLRLFYGEDTLPTPDFINEAAKRALDRGCTFYTPNAGYPALREAIVARLRDLHELELSAERDIIVTASGMVGLAVACRAVLAPGDSALVISPVWPNIPAAIRMTGAQVIEVPLACAASGFALDLPALETGVRADTRLLVLASPGNPTGWTATAADWDALVAFCERHDLWLLDDGVYERMIFTADSVAPWPLACSGARERTIVVHSFSKTYRMTGWRIGYTIAPPELARVLPTLHEFVVSHAFGVAQEAALVALLEGERFVEESRQRYQRNRDLAVERLCAIPGVTLAAPSGAFYAFPRFRGLADSQAFCEWMVREYRVGVAPGSAFGDGGEGHIRLCFAVEESTLLEALDRLAAAWSAWQERMRQARA